MVISEKPQSGQAPIWSICSMHKAYGNAVECLGFLCTTQPDVLIGSLTAHDSMVMWKTTSGMFQFYYQCDAATLWYRSLCCALCLSIRASQVGVLLKWLDRSSRFLAQSLPSIYPTLCYNGFWVSSKIGVFPFVTLTQTLNLGDFFCFFRHGISIVASVVNLVWLVTVASLSHRGPTFVYYSMSMTHSIAWFICDGSDLFKLWIGFQHITDIC